MQSNQSNKKMKVIFIANGNSISAKFSLVSINSFSHLSSTRITRNKDKETLDKGYSYSVKATDFEDIVDKSKILYNELEIDTNSIDSFYCFQSSERDVYSKKLTKAFIEKWVNYDCPVLYKYEINKEGNINFLGQPLLMFYNSLVESSWDHTYLDSDIEDFEIELLLKHTNTNWHIHTEINKFKVARNTKSEDIEKAYEFVKKYENTVQGIIDEHKEEIEDGVKDMLENESKFGFDCGDLYVVSYDKEFMSNKELLFNAPEEINKYKKNMFNKYIRVDFPIGTQSTTIERKMFDIVKPYLIEKFGDTIGARVILD